MKERWDQRLSLEEQQRLAFARLLLHGPRWVLLDDALGALDEGQRQSMLAIFERELAATAVVSVGRSSARNSFYDRTLYCRRLDESSTLVPLRPRPRPQRGGSAPRSSRSARAHRPNLDLSVSNSRALMASKLQMRDDELPWKHDWLLSA